MFQLLLDWFGRLQILQALGQWAWAYVPAGWAILTGGAGILGGQPLMWVMLAASGAAAFGFVAFLGFDIQRERRNPLNKLKVLGTIFPHDLSPPVEHNRQIRRGMAKTNLVVPAKPRTVLKGQLGLQLLNSASFPISVILWSAETEIDGKKPPRTNYPKKAALIQPGAPFWAHDDPIDLFVPSDTLKGSMKMVVKYGRPGQETFELVQDGTVEIFMEPSGLLKQIYFHPAELLSKTT